METYRDIINCPNCNSQDCEKAVFPPTRELLIFCPECGYKYEIECKLDDDSKPLLIDKTKGISYDNIYHEITEIKNPFGVRVTERTDGVQQLGTIEDSTAFLTSNYIGQIFL